MHEIELTPQEVSAIQVFYYARLTYFGSELFQLHTHPWVMIYGKIYYAVKGTGIAETQKDTQINYYRSMYAEYTDTDFVYN